jgi:GT2 family glycosyltransferase
MVSIDLVLATVGRTKELTRFLDALADQSFRPVRIHIVDQNADDRLGACIDPYENVLKINWLRSQRGLSRARNVGLKHLDGDIVSFPDDDCWYGEGLLSAVARFFDEHPSYGGLTTRLTDTGAGSSAVRWAQTLGDLRPLNIWTRGVSSTMFLRRSVIATVGSFDETLGAGSGTEWGSGEESDYLLRCLEAGFEIRYDPALTVNHLAGSAPSTTDVQRGLSYGMGMGRVLRNHRFPPWFAAYYVGRALAGSALSLALGQRDGARYHLSVARGRARGYLSQPRGDAR